MKVTLITPTPPDAAAFGVRALSAYLKREGKQVRNIFLPGGVKKNRYRSGFVYHYEDNIVDETVELCRGSDLVGVSFMTNYFDRAVQLTSAIRQRLDCPVVWGGIHATVAPEDSLKHVDIVCLGEAEEALLELVEKMEAGRDFLDTKNFWFKSNGKIVKNSPRPLIQDLDSLPYCDFGLDDHFVYDHLKNTVAPMTKELLKRCFPSDPDLDGTFYDSFERRISYKTMTTRGCPHHCTFCAERTLAEMYSGQRYLRRRGVKHVIGELEYTKKHLPFIESIYLFDDTFTARPVAEIIEFAKEYKEKIGLPYHIQASPKTLTSEKLDALVDSGCIFVEMGIQSTSANAMELYKRNNPGKMLLEKARLINGYVGRIHPPIYHLILDNPWETTSDVLETIDVLLDIPAPFSFKKGSLVFFPGTALYEKAKAEGILKTEDDEREEIYNKHFGREKGSYVNLLIYFIGFSYFPRSIIRLLSTRPFVFLFDREIFDLPFTLIKRCGDAAIILSKGVRALFTGDLKRIYRFLMGWYT